MQPIRKGRAVSALLASCAKGCAAGHAMGPVLVVAPPALGDGSFTQSSHDIFAMPFLPSCFWRRWKLPSFALSFWRSSSSIFVHFGLEGCRQGGRISSEGDSVTCFMSSRSTCPPCSPRTGRVSSVTSSASRGSAPS